MLTKPATSDPPSDPEDPHRAPARSRPAPAPRDEGRAEVGVVGAVHRRLVWLPAVLGLVGGAAAWFTIPPLLELDSDTRSATEALFAGLVVLLAVAGTFVSHRLLRPLRGLAARLLAGAAPDETLLSRVAQVVVWHPRWMGLGVGATGVGVVGILALWGHHTLDLPVHTAWVATGAGACIAIWLALILSTMERSAILPVTRVLSGLGLKRWPSVRVTVTGKVTGYMVAASLISAVLVGTVAYQLADSALVRQVAEDRVERIPTVLDWVAELHASGTGRRQLEAALTRAEARMGSHTRLVLLRDGEVVAGRSSLAADVRDHYRYRLGEASSVAVLPDSLDVAAWAPVGRPGYAGLAVTDREVVRRRFARSGLEVALVILATLVLGGLLGVMLSGSMRAPIRDMVEASARMAEGDLSPPGGRVVGDDEIGEVNERMEEMRERLAVMVSRVAEQARAVATSARRTLAQAGEIEQGAGMQAESLLGATSAVEEIDASIRALGDSLRELARIFRDNTRTGTLIGDEILNLARDLENLSTGSREAAEGVAAFSRDGETVATEIGGLTELVGRARAAWERVGGGLSEVQAEAQRTTELGHSMMETAQAGAVEVRRTVEGIERIQESADAAADRVEALSNRIGDVSRVLEVIDDIAEQTSLLALNASIIAAQAGEHGRSFAVVAAEVRDLADRTASSTREIAATVTEVEEAGADVARIIRDSGGRVTEGVARAEQAEHALQEILMSVAATTRAAEAITGTGETQRRTVAEATREIEDVAAAANRIGRLAQGQVETGGGVRRRVEDMARLIDEMSRALSGLAERNRGLAASHRSVNEHVGRLEQSVTELGHGSTAIVQETGRIQDVVEASTQRAAALQATAEELDRAAESLLSDMKSFALGDEAS